MGLEGEGCGGRGGRKWGERGREVGIGYPPPPPPPPPVHPLTTLLNKKSYENLRKPWNQRTPQQTIFQFVLICLDTLHRLKKDA